MGDWVRLVRADGEVIWVRGSAITLIGPRTLWRVRAGDGDVYARALQVGPAEVTVLDCDQNAAILGLDVAGFSPEDGA